MFLKDREAVTLNSVTPFYSLGNYIVREDVNKYLKVLKLGMLKKHLKNKKYNVFLMHIFFYIIVCYLMEHNQ